MTMAPMPLPRTGGTRQTRPAYAGYTAAQKGGGLGVVPRRGWDDRTTRWIEYARQSPHQALSRWAVTAPLRLLQVLVTTHPLAKMATSNLLAFAFAPGDVRIVGDEVSASGTNAQQNDEATAIADAFWGSLPSCIGGLTGLLGTLGKQQTWSGMYTFEGVPSDQPRGGVIDVATVDPLTFRYRDVTRGGGNGVPRRQVRILEQQQVGLPTRMNGWKEVDQTTVFAVPFDGDTDNPYGVPLYSAGLQEILKDLAGEQNVTDILRAVAWPHLFFEFPWDAVSKYGSENPEECLKGMAPDGGDLTPSEYAQMVFDFFSGKLEALLADDNILLPSGAKGSVLSGGQGLKDLTELLEMRRLRVVQGLDHLPTLLGITQGGTLAYNSTEFRSFAKKIKRFRSGPVWGAVQLLNLHYRLLGLPFVARAEMEELQTSDKESDARAFAMKVDAWLKLADRGYVSDDDAAMELTGSKVQDPQRALAAHESSLRGNQKGGADQQAQQDYNQQNGQTQRGNRQ